MLVFWQEENETKMRIQALDNAAKQLGKEYEVGDEVSNYIYNMFGGDDGNLYYDNSSSLMQYDLSSKKSTELVNWINSDLNISNIDTSRVTIASEKELYLVSNSYNDDAGKTEIIRLDWVDPKELKEKSILTLAASYINYDIQMAVVNFNKTSDRYRITVGRTTPPTTPRRTMTGQPRCSTTISRPATFPTFCSFLRICRLTATAPRGCLRI